MTERVALRALADRAGIIAEYVDQTGRETRTTSDETRVALLAAMGLDGETEAAAQRTLERLDDEDRQDHLARESAIVTPGRCPAPHDVTGGKDVFGLTVNLYAVHGRKSWGIGNLGDLRAIAEWGAERGASFVGANPLHALFNRDGQISPYSPVSRLFRNPLYLDISAIPELAESLEARRLVESNATQRTLVELRTSHRVEYERIAQTIDPVLHALFGTFAEKHRGTGTARARAFAEYVESQGDALENFATFLALDGHFARLVRGSRKGVPWRQWPEAYRTPASDAVREFRESNQDAVDRHRYIQFELDTQLAAAAATAREQGMSIGLYQDLAIGSSPDGSDAWAFPGLFVDGAAIGAPPDSYAATGQNWGLPPIDPRRLRRDGYRYWIQLLRSSLRHAGALRIDHVLGLFRQFWIPHGKTGDQGAYVRLPSRDLLDILAREATRAGALVVGEDLGTVPPDVPPALEDRRVLSSKVFFFERTFGGGFKSAGSYAPLALATATTHDMPTIAGWWDERDITLRNHVGVLGKRDDESDPEVVAARAERGRDKAALLHRLAEDGVLPSDQPRSHAELCAAIHRLLCKSPAALVGLSLDDIVGEEEPVNVPGVGPDEFPSWTRRLRVSLEDLRSDPSIWQSLGCERRSSR